MSESPRRRFASKTIPGHLARGVVGLLALIAALVVASGQHGRLSPLLALPLLGLAVAMFRGCPTCWAIGLAETAACRRRPPAVPTPDQPRSAVS